MKIYISIIAILCAIVSNVHAQIGINTKNPSGVFHIDLNQNSPTTTTDDIIFTEDGYLGIGTTAPTAQVHINTPVGYSNMQIVDGYQKAGRVLVSDANGFTGWGTMRASAGEKFSLPAATYTKGVITKLNLGGSTSYKVSADGNYLVFIRWWGKTTGLINTTTSNAYYFFYRNGTAIDTIEYYVPIGTVNTYLSFTVVLAAPGCKKGDTLEIGVRPQSGNWTTHTGSYLPTTVTFFMM
jgi:hypothetical protein